jgi:hypothetical protein
LNVKIGVNYAKNGLFTPQDVLKDWLLLLAINKNIDKNKKLR